MIDRVAITQEEIDSRRQLVALAAAMLAGELTFFEGASQVLRLWTKVGGVTGDDPDFEAFSIISSETDHLPLAESRQYWAKSALERVAPEIEHTEQWARGFAPKACASIIERFRADGG
jgi:hypothetical protein